ncbi:hypothetical protein [Sulfuracidifex metallicus]|uniref:Uncharacterized protein n=1 Tax=Sulfuracidifex metallicus DSM 6482 = JCM 9184 TaxID=523847 RepID=A0A6A9QKB4_SULME|nr:hypothetical protein [Sulfuracidifex metallicus]MUN28168.1 hypothetical protein [Sulfuracidifex metallicus DSM 6482 = JCM 9184]WOE51297.1 hypothetical protein RQ359_000568 [Sulfuracidifex metallicus DSM 6482 = JCM 9184]
MSLREVLDRFLKDEEDIIYIKNINPDEFKENEIPLGTTVIMEVKGRRRLMDLGLLSIIYNRCNGINFVKDYLNLNYSLEDIHKKYKVYTELEYFSLYCPPMHVDGDFSEVAVRLKAYILSRENC